ncbi:MAG: histidine phosphatase family protein [SAR324 cluster bacterium]|nr:histidine phosphatase family protein [SAR324 cluster bacterium]
MSSQKEQSLPTRLLLIRHAQTEWNIQRRFQGHGDSPITEEGQEQLQRLKSRLAGLEFDVVYSSDLRRTMETSKMLSGKQRVEEPRLRERGVGILEGLNLEQIMAEHAEAFRAFRSGDKDHQIEGGESLQIALNRAWTFLEEMPEKHPGAELVAVSHAGLIRLICKKILGLALDAPNFFQIPNTSLTQLVFSPKDRSWSLECLADTTHLQPVFDPLVVI